MGYNKIPKISWKYIKVYIIQAVQFTNLTILLPESMCQLTCGGSVLPKMLNSATASISSSACGVMTSGTSTVEWGGMIPVGSGLVYSIRVVSSISCRQSTSKIKSMDLRSGRGLYRDDHDSVNWANPANHGMLVNDFVIPNTGYLLLFFFYCFQTMKKKNQTKDIN